MNARSVPRKVKYYTCREVPLSELPVKEVQPGEDHPAVLDYFWRFMNLGQRSFGLFLDNRFRTMASLVQLTGLQAKLLALKRLIRPTSAKVLPKLYAPWRCSKG